MARYEPINYWRWGAVALKLTNIINHTTVPYSIPIQKSKSTTTILDSVTLSHYVTRHDEKRCINVKKTTQPNPVQFTNVTNINATNQVQFQISNTLYNRAQQGHTYNDLKNGTLISIG